MIKDHEVDSPCLRGSNRIRAFRTLADDLADRISQMEGVAGIVFLGGLVREFADASSDIDITVLLEGRNPKLSRRIESLGKSLSEGSGVDVDLEVHSLGDFSRGTWDDTRLWDYETHEVVFDPRGRVSRAIESKLKVPDDYWRRRVVENWMHLQWAACMPAGKMSIAETLVARGNIIAAHFCVNDALDLLFNLLFALNRRFTPPPKWKVHYVVRLPWTPRGFADALTKTVLVKSLTVPELRRRTRELQRLRAQLLEQVLSSLSMSEDELIRYYVASVVYR